MYDIFPKSTFLKGVIDNIQSIHVTFHLPHPLHSRHNAYCSINLHPKVVASLLELTLLTPGNVFNNVT